MRRFLWDDVAIPYEQTREILSRSEYLMETVGLGLWTITPAASGGLIGLGGYWHVREPSELELLLALEATQWKRGYATEAGHSLIHYGFEQLGLERVRASTDRPNLASRRLMVRLGMEFELSATIRGLDTVFHIASRETWDGFHTDYRFESDGPERPGRT